MANTKPVVDNVETLKYINEKAKDAVINVLQVGSITKGFEGKEINKILTIEASGIGIACVVAEWIANYGYKSFI